MRRDSYLCAEIAVFVLNLSDIIFLGMAPHQSRCGVTDEQNGKYISLWQHLKLSLAPTVLSKRFLRTRYGMRSVVY